MSGLSEPSIVFIGMKVARTENNVVGDLCRTVLLASTKPRFMAQKLQKHRIKILTLIVSTAGPNEPFSTKVSSFM